LPFFQSIEQSLHLSHTKTKTFNDKQHTTNHQSNPSQQTTQANLQDENDTGNTQQISPKLFFFFVFLTVYLNAQSPILAPYKFLFFHFQTKTLTQQVCSLTIQKSRKRKTANFTKKKFQASLQV